MTYLLPAVSDRHPQLKSTSFPLVFSTTRLQNLSGKLFRGPHLAMESATMMMMIENLRKKGAVCRVPVRPPMA